MRKRISHWKKRISRKNELAILNLLEENPLRFNDLLMRLKEINCKMSPPTLTSHLKDLEEQKKLIERYFDNRRKGNYYRLKSRTASALFRKYEALAFIEGINNPLYAYKEMKGKAIAAFTNRSGNKKIDRFTQIFLEDQVKYFLPFMKGPKKGKKIAVILMTGVSS